MAQSHEGRERSRRECGSCGHPDHRLVAARAVRVAYGYARAPLLPPDPRQPDHTAITVADEAEQATKEEAPGVNHGECTHTHRRPIVAPAARVAYGHARPPPLLARWPQCPPPAPPTAGAGGHGGLRGEDAAAHGHYPHYRRAAGTYPALSYRAPGYAEAAGAAAAASRSSCCCCCFGSWCGGRPRPSCCPSATRAAERRRVQGRYLRWARRRQRT